MNYYIELALKILGIIPLIIIPFTFFYSRLSDRRTVLLNDLKILKELDPESDEYKDVNGFISDKINRIYGSKPKVHHWLGLCIGIIYFVGIIVLCIYMFKNYGLSTLLILIASNIVNAIFIIAAAFSQKGVKGMFE